VADLKAQLASIVGPAQVLTDAADTAPYLTDWRGRYSGAALAVVRPATTRQTADVVGACAAAGAAIVPQGGNTGLVGGATPRGGEVVISLTRLNRMRGIDAANATMLVEAGCTLHSVQEAARAAGFLFPLSLAAEGSATIGGNLSTNAGGVHVLRYGTARDLVLGLEVVLADGRIWDGLRGLRKDNTGYDLKQLFVGAEGTLGLITAAVLKLFPMARARLTAWATVADAAAAVALLERLREVCGERVAAFEIIGRSALNLVLKHLPNARDPRPGGDPWAVLIELTDSDARADLAGMLATAVATESGSGGVGEIVIAGSDSQAAALWALRENISEAQRREGVSIKHDISLPLSRIAEFVARADAALLRAFPGIRMVTFGHVGDGNLHYNQSKPEQADNAAFIARSDEVNRLVHDLVHELGGSISAEHGLGQLKRGEILRYKSQVEMELMRRIKDALDPAGLMNPGKML
jgi:FAD/FMN-containing dehydrogenase